MEQHLSHAEITKRLGRPPEEWTFLGQCYRVDDFDAKLCVLTLRESQCCFTIKPKDGLGRMTVSPDAFKYFKKYNPELYLKLRTGLLWLQMRTKEVEESKNRQVFIARIRVAEKRYKAARSKGEKALVKYRRANKAGSLPPTLHTLRMILVRTMPRFKGLDTKALWLEQNALELETALLDLTPEQPTVAREESELVATFAPIPELEF